MEKKMIEYIQVERKNPSNVEKSVSKWLNPRATIIWVFNKLVFFPPHILVHNWFGVKPHCYLLFCSKITKHEVYEKKGLDWKILFDYSLLHKNPQKAGNRKKNVTFHIALEFPNTYDLGFLAS